MASKLNGDDQGPFGLLIRGMGDPSMRERAIRILDTSPAMSGIRKDAFVHASFLMALGEHERALAALAGLCAQRRKQHLPVFVEPGVRSDPQRSALQDGAGEGGIAIQASHRCRAMNFLEELKRRHVYRVAAAYAVVGWLLIQVATQVFPVFHLPDWIDQAVVLLILIGFPIALVLAWAFDATPHGIVATDSRDPAPDPRGRQRSRRAGAAVAAIGVLIALIAGGAYWHFGRLATPSVVKVADTAHGAMSSPDAAQRNSGKAAPDFVPVASVPVSAQSVAIPAKSVAVLPFVNMSGDPKNDYFSDGITEEVLDALAQLPHLKVAARTSAFAFKGKAEDLRKVGRSAGCRDGAGRQRAAIRRRGAHHRAVDRHPQRLSPVVGKIRPQAHQHLRGRG